MLLNNLPGAAAVASAHKIVVTTDDGSTYTQGRIVNGRPGPAVDSEGRKLTNTYSFVFENMVPA